MPAKKPAKPQPAPKLKPGDVKPREPRDPMSPEAKARVRRFVVHGLGATLLTGACTAGFVASKRYVERITPVDRPPAVVLAERPVWMSDRLAEQILSTARPDAPSLPTDRRPLAAEAAALSASPWVRRVNAVRRVYQSGPGDTIVLDCDFRTPVALVRWQDAYCYVDAAGVRLPEQLTGPQVRQLVAPGGAPMFRVIEGCAQAPAAPGKPWPGKDIQAGLELIGLLNDKSYADQITRIDVGNYDGRVNANESQINLVTRYATQIRWGQAPSSRAFFSEQRVDRKLDVLQQACRQTGRVDMNLPWIDLRFDYPTAPSTAAGLAPGQRASLDVGR